MRTHGSRGIGWRWLWIGAVAALLLVVAAAVALQLGVGRDRDVQAGLPGAERSHIGGSPSSPVACNVTRPDGSFVPPPPYRPSPPPRYGSEWFGSTELWTMLRRRGEVWSASALPRAPGGLVQKTFWWSADYRGPSTEPEPPITVVGRRLDGPGDFTTVGGTHAMADFGVAMLAGAAFPSAGCWELTGRYRGTELSYVVLITED